MKLRYKILIGLVVVLCISAVGLAVAKSAWDREFLVGYDPSAPLNAVVRGEEERPDYHRIDLTFDGMPGQAVPTLLAEPRDMSGPFPCIIFLYGINQKKEFLDDIAAVYTKAGFAICCQEQYTKGERKLPGKNPVRDLFALRRRAALNVIETRRLVDYLQTRSEIAHDRIYLLGASYGAITGCTAAAFEPRIAAAVMTYGGGNLPLLFDSEASKKELGILHNPVSWVMQYVMAPADPIRYVSKISPRPSLFQSGSYDQIVPAASGEALYEAASEPKKFIMYDSDHIGLDEAHVYKVLNDTLAWLKEIDASKTRVAATDVNKPQSAPEGALSSN
ncbi:MAG: prolyl oligopeptidase family serine peptidase [Candidatus Hydrogenedentes bacterium]|nr:prolyl oligopeptidase family serine peptidase [Candidatus Hydrogenedentota bacterium]